MIKKLFLLIGIFSFSAYSQHNCGSNHNFIQNSIQNHLKNKNTALGKSVNNPSPSNLVYIPLKIWFVRHTDGSFSTNTSLDPFLNSLVETNKLFNQMGIRLYIQEFQYLNNSDWLSPARGGTHHNALKANIDTNVANVWISDSWPNDPATGYGGPGGVELNDLSEATVPHEFGHFFELLHTFETGNGAELVNGSNCITAGDKVCDTPADPGASSYSWTNCNNNNNLTDSNGQVYAPMYSNIMSYYGGTCGFEFTQGQYDRMLAAYDQYHDTYSGGGGEITGAPSGLTIVNYTGYDELSWTNFSGSRGTSIEYSTDGGSSWNVLDGVLASKSSAPISNAIVGQNYKYRARHLNSTVYSNVVDYSPTLASPYKPGIARRSSTSFVTLEEFEVSNTTISTVTQNENYTLHTATTPPKLFVGGSNAVRMKALSLNGYSNNTFFLVYVDENQDGDFEDAGELKYQNDNDNVYDEWTVNSTLNISSTATPGYTRIRVRTVQQTSTESPTMMYHPSETEDFIVELVGDSAPTNLTAVFQSSDNTVDLAWSDTYDTYQYVIERSTNGVDFTEIGTTTDGTVKTYTDSSPPPNSQISYRVNRVSSNETSREATINTPLFNLAYCSPAGDYAEHNGVCMWGSLGIDNITISAAGFSNVSTGSCGVTNFGYSDYYDTNTINLNAGTTYQGSIDHGSTGGVFVKVFLDLNHDGVFEESGDEVVFEGSEGAFSISIPSDALNGSTRIRFRGNGNQVSSPCGVGSWGETEDYKVVISRGKEQKVQNALADNPTDTSIDLSWDVAQGASPTGFIIKQSTDGVNYTQITNLGSSERSYTASSLTQGNTYYFQIIATGTQNSEPAVVWGSPSGTPLSTDNVEKLKVLVFPNPAIDGTVFIRSDKKVDDIKVYDLRGVLLKRIKDPIRRGNEYVVPGLKNGFKFLQLSIENKPVTVKLIVN